MHKNILTVVGITILFLGVGIQPAIAIVNISSSSIQDLIDNASDGDTIYIPSGTYYENIVIYKSINLIGEDQNTTIIDGQGKINVVDIIADNVLIQGFTIQNGTNEGGGIYIWSNYSKIINNNIKDNYYSGIYLGGKSHDNIISNNIITNNNVGVKIDKYKTTILESENNTISNNIIDCNYKGIILDCGRGEVVTGNIVSNSDDGGIWIFLRGNNIIENNSIESCDEGIWLLDTNNNFIYHNKINNSYDEGISIHSSEKNNISNNEISYNKLGIEFGNSINNIIYENTISYNHRGVYFECTSYRNKFLNNEFFDNDIGIHVRPGNFENVFSNNQFFNDGFKIESYQTYCSNNMVNGKPFIYLEQESDKELDKIDAGQIILTGCKSILIENNEISDTCIGIQLFDCKECVISNNKLTNNKNAGIHIRGSKNSIIGNYISSNSNGISIIDDNNIIEGNYISNNEVYGIKILGGDTLIEKNHIQENDHGVFLEGPSNIIKKNNFISNERDASFEIWKFDPGRNKWIGNHWSQKITPFKIIFGTKVFVILIFKIIPIPIPLPWINIDFLPAKEPYHI